MNSIAPLSTGDPHPSLPQRIPRVGEHVFYVIPNKAPVSALVSIVFGEHGMPRLTLFIVRPGGGDVRVLLEIPHKDHAVPERPYYVLPWEAL